MVDWPNAVDRLYRYVDWNGTRYSADAFVSAARRAGVESLVLTAPHEAGERCVAALAGALKVPAYRADAADGRTARLRSSYRPAKVACDIGDGDIRVGEEYFRHRIARRGSEVVLDDGAASSPADAVAALRRLSARTLVAPSGSVEDLLCFDAIAREAEVILYETGADGQLQPATVRAGLMLDQACKGAH
ncbi:hypothetical protein [Tahibacter caeni]|uniref:hypothetical protein n=1 Tax=Tahibacter caeni TaxID=1453545 RepID=UPI00214913B0|nr:hypothetical protein [Tahibacter caeni]